MGMTILLVDDSATTRAMLGKLLRLTGLELADVRGAANGREALDRLAEDEFDLVITDLHMPEMSGLELVERMDQTGLLAEVPVIVLSTEGSEERIDDLKRRGVRAYLRKPCTPEQVRETILSVLGNADEA